MTAELTGVRSFLRWAGSKRQLLPVLAEYWNSSFERYVEPFAGSCSLFFAIGPDRALLSDRNSDLVQALTMVRDDPASVHKLASSFETAASDYYRIRSIDPATLSAPERAARFVYLNRNAFNGIYRTNSRGVFNVPFGTKTGSLPPAEAFDECSFLLRKAELRSWDFGTTVRYAKAGDFVYLDPPYAVSNRRVFRQYGPHEFGLNDLKRLTSHLDRMNDRGVTFLLSYADCKEAREIGTRWNSRRVRVRRNVAGFTGARRFAYELLVTNAPEPGERASN